MDTIKKHDLHTSAKSQEADGEEKSILKYWFSAWSVLENLDTFILMSNEEAARRGLLKPAMLARALDQLVQSGYSFPVNDVRFILIDEEQLPLLWNICSLKSTLTSSSFRCQVVTFPNLLNHIVFLYPSQEGILSRSRPPCFGSRGGRNASYFFATQAFGMHHQITFDPLYLAAIRAAWNWLDDKDAPPVPLPNGEQHSYLTETNPTSEFARTFVLKIFELRGLPVPQSLVEVASSSAAVNLGNEDAGLPVL